MSILCMTRSRSPMPPPLGPYRPTAWTSSTKVMAPNSWATSHISSSGHTAPEGEPSPSSDYSRALLRSPRSGVPGSIFARVNKVESLATKQEVNSSAASLSCRPYICTHSHDGLGDPGVAAHAQVVVAAPHGHVALRAERLRVVVGHGEGGGAAVHRLEDPYSSYWKVTTGGREREEEEEEEEEEFLN
ncbi:hypothetical protein EYF80_044499 [Liparis tanakae]|uniref:Uncharacterized protein n=1 Tax=Liparis tanakae TaxID=230148 RepID=A0A4Z2FXQ3_9TELE|nr:hypothetical protein EYF80_044499 [Liparis tanakae]